MVRVIAIAGLLVALIAAVVFGPSYLSSTDTQAPAGGSAAACDLQAGPCTWENEAGQWSVAITSVGTGDQGTEFRLSVTAPTHPGRFLAVLRGESMYMGEYPVPLKQAGDNRYTAQFTAPFCTNGSEMQWRIDLQSGEDPVGRAPEKLTFWAR